MKMYLTSMNDQPMGLCISNHAAVSFEVPWERCSEELTYVWHRDGGAKYQGELTASVRLEDCVIQPAFRDTLLRRTGGKCARKTSERYSHLFATLALHMKRTVGLALNLT